MVILHFRVQRNGQVIQMELYDNYDIYIYIYVQNDACKLKRTIF